MHHPSWELGDRLFLTYLFPEPDQVDLRAMTTISQCLAEGYEGDQSRALQEIPQFELCYRMGYNLPPGDSSEN